MGDSAIKNKNSRVAFFISIYSRTPSGSTDAAKVSSACSKFSIARLWIAGMVTCLTPATGLPTYVPTQFWKVNWYWYLLFFYQFIVVFLCQFEIVFLQFNIVLQHIFCFLIHKLSELWIFKLPTLFFLIFASNRPIYTHFVSIRA